MSEIRDLTWNKIDLINKFIVTNNRTISISKSTVSFLEKLKCKQLEESRYTGYNLVFHKGGGEEIILGTVTKKLKYISASVGFEISNKNILRETFAMLMANKGVDKNDLEKQLGKKSLNELNSCYFYSKKSTNEVKKFDAALEELCAEINHFLDLSLEREIQLKPDRETLKGLIYAHTFDKIGKRCRVKDNAVRHWCKQYGLPSKTKDIKKIEHDAIKDIVGDEDIDLKQIAAKPKENITKEELKKLIFKYSFSEIGRAFGVADNTVRNWCKKFGLPHKAQDINTNNF